MRFTCGGSPLDLPIGQLTVAGWTGRDRAAIDHHIAELAEIGVTPPSAVPLYYRVAASLLTREDSIQTVGAGSSGEVEPLIVSAGGRTWLGLASDHTDRELEAHSVALSKQVCAKPCAGEIWEFEPLADRLDAIEMRSWIREGGEWVHYQEGSLSAIRPLRELVDGAGLERLAEGGGAAMLCGTFGVISGGVRPAPEFRMEIHDPAMGRSIRHSYAVETLPAIA